MDKLINKTMREILFRGKRIYNQEWVFGNLITDEHGQISIMPPERIEADGHHLRIGCDEPVFTEIETIGQFTGLIDKDGVKIFEGDMLLYLGAKGEVYYDNNSAMFMCKFKTNRSVWSFDSMDDIIEVVGSIHDK